MRIILTGGGSGGHVYPLIAVARKIKEIKPETEIFYVGPVYNFEKAIFDNNSIRPFFILSGKMRRYFSPFFIVDIFKLIVGFFQSIFLMLYLMPDLVFSKGGYGSVPVVFVSWLYRISIYLHESDTIPGLANRFCSKFAVKVFISFESSKGYFKNKQIIFSGNPIRHSITGGNIKNAILEFKLNSGRKKILILGGSQGSQVIYDLVLNSLSLLVNKYEIIHQCGKKSYNDIDLFLKAARNKDFSNYYHPVSYLDETQIADLYKIADLIVSRAGAGSIFEIASSFKPSILIPLASSANNHQERNAYEYSNAGAAIVLEEENLTPNLFLNQIDKILETNLKDEISLKAKDFYRDDASEIIAKEITGV